MQGAKRKRRGPGVGIGSLGTLYLWLFLRLERESLVESQALLTSQQLDIELL